MVHHKDSISEVLNYIYNSIGLKYDKVKTKDTVVGEVKNRAAKDKLQKFVHQTKLTRRQNMKGVYKMVKFNLLVTMPKVHECNYSKS